MKKKYITAEELEKKFEAAEDITEYLALEKAERPGLQQRRISVDFPAWMIRKLDLEAKRMGVTRQSVIKFWISERLKI